MPNPRSTARSSYISEIVKVASDHAETAEQKAILENLQKGFLLHDETLFADTYNALNKLDDQTSLFRQVVMQQLEDQTFEYCNGVLQSILLCATVGSYATGYYVPAIFYAACSHVVEATNRYLERTKEHVNNTTNHQTSSIPQLSDINLVENTARVANKICKCLHSNLLFFKNNCSAAVTNKVVAEPVKLKLG